MHSWALVIAKGPNTHAYNIESRLMDALFGLSECLAVGVKKRCCMARSVTFQTK